MKEENAYILGTERAELHRLGIQHQIWAAEMRRGWEIAEFGADQTILDLGCGPGFGTRELAYMVGDHGKVIGVDLSPSYTKFCQKVADTHGLSNIELMTTSFDEMQLEEESLDGIYHRWALAWIPNPEEVIAKLYNALKPGGVIVSHEYYDWSFFQTEPKLPALNHAIGKAFQSFTDSPGDINIGRHLPRLFDNIGLEVISTRSMSKIAYNYDTTWQWPLSFLELYVPKLEQMGLLTKEEISAALDELKELEELPGSSIACPAMYEVVAVKA